jgi:hypothetical protein
MSPALSAFVAARIANYLAEATERYQGRKDRRRARPGAKGRKSRRRASGNPLQARPSFHPRVSGAAIIQARNRLHFSREISPFGAPGNE